MLDYPLNNLNPSKLVTLAADILARRGHTNVRIVDGPGDGCRDIHSMDEHGQKFLTQCKFHQDSTATVASRETGDLAIGLHRLGYRNGLFVTNARMSPQSKREFLDNYPGFGIDFLEGQDLLKAVRSDIVLRAIWYDGQSVDSVANVIILAFTARDLTTDKPIEPTTFLEGKDLAPEILDIHGGKIQFAIRRRMGFPLSRLEPYRLPTKRSIFEGSWDTMAAFEVAVTGAIHWAGFDDVIDAAYLYAARVLSTASNRFAIRMSAPRLIPLEGSSTGSEVDLGLPPDTLLYIDETCLTEFDYYLPTRESEWKPPLRFGTSVSDWVCWHSNRLNTCLHVNIESPPSIASRISMSVRIEALLNHWNRSLFALVPKDKHEEVRNLEPDFVGEWIGEDLLCAWYYRSPAGELGLILTDDEAWEEMGLPPNRSHDMEEVLSRVSNALVAIGAKLVPPAIARHAFAALGNDPIPNDEKIIYRSVDLLRDPEIIPSPINPASRIISFVWCEQLSIELDNSSAETLCSKLESTILETQRDCIAARVEYDLDVPGKSVLIFYTRFPNAITSTDSLVLELESILQDTQRTASNALKEYDIDHKNITKDYWISEYGISFPE